MYLIQCVVQALVQVLQVAQDNRVTQLHGDLDAVDVQADLPVLLVVGKAGAEDDGGVSHVQQILQIQKHYWEN
jgi:hypothetical protein